MHGPPGLSGERKSDEGAGDPVPSACRLLVSFRKCNSTGGFKHHLKVARMRCHLSVSVWGVNAEHANKSWKPVSSCQPFFLWWFSFACAFALYLFVYLFLGELVCDIFVLCFFPGYDFCGSLDGENQVCHPFALTRKARGEYILYTIFLFVLVCFRSCRVLTQSMDFFSLTTVLWNILGP